MEVGCETDALIPTCDLEWGRVRAGCRRRKGEGARRRDPPEGWRFRFPRWRCSSRTSRPSSPRTRIGEGLHSPINIASGESVPFAHWDADRPLDRFVRLADEDQEQELARRREEISAWVDEKLAEDDGKVKKSTRDRMQPCWRRRKPRRRPRRRGSPSRRRTEYDDDGPSPTASRRTRAAVPDSSLRTMASQREEMIAAEEEEEEALFGRAGVLTPRL